MSYIHVQIPIWLKKRALEKAKIRAQGISDFFRALLVADLGTKDEPK